MSLETDLQAVLAALQAHEGKQDTFVNGSTSDTVAGTGGTYPSLNKLTNDVQTTVDAISAQVTADKDAAAASASAAAASAASVDGEEIVQRDLLREFKNGFAATRTSTSLDFTLSSVPVQNIGTSDFCVCWIGRIFDTTAATKLLCSGTDGANDFYLGLDTSAGVVYDVGNFRISFGASTFAIDYGSAIFDVDAFWLVSFDRDGNASLYRNDQLIGSTNISSASTTNLDFTFLRFFDRQNTAWKIEDFGLANFAPTASQVAAIYKNGVAGWLAENSRYKWGYNNYFNGDGAGVGATDANVNSTNVSTNSTISVEAGARTSGAGSYFMRATATGATHNIGWPLGRTYLSGDKIKIPSIWVRETGSYTGLILRLSDTGGTAKSNTPSILPTIEATWEEFTEIELTATGTVDRVIITATGATASDTIDIDDFDLTITGITDAFQCDEGANFQLHNLNPSGEDALLSATGVSWLQPKVGHCYINDSATASTATQRDVADRATAITDKQMRFKAVVIESDVAEWVELWADPEDGGADVQITSRYTLTANTPAELPLLSTLPDTASQLSLYWKFETATAKTYTATIEMSKIKHD